MVRAKRSRSDREPEIAFRHADGCSRESLALGSERDAGSVVSVVTARDKLELTEFGTFSLSTRQLGTRAARASRRFKAA